jgi:hypothetical protein
MRLPARSIAMALLLASCVSPPPERAPVPKPPEPQAPINTLPTINPPAIFQPKGHWTDWTLAQGSWVYRRDDRGSIALYGVPGRDALVTLRCDTERGRIFLSRTGNSAGALTVRTSSTSKNLNILPTGGLPAYVAAEVAPVDPLLDAIAYSRGRIALEMDSVTSIAIPVWSEIGRVVEDCRS